MSHTVIHGIAARDERPAAGRKPPATTTRRLPGPALVALMLAALVCLLLPAAALADAPAPDPAGPEKCGLCHLQEVETWQASPHAQALDDIEDAFQLACGEEMQIDCTCLTCHTTDFNIADRSYAHGGVTCEACHGAYVEDHPANGTMQLAVDSAVCSECHVETHQQWSETEHAAAGVQCIGCHRAHSQELRLTDQVLCESCHRSRLEDSGHVNHDKVGVSCVDCHASPADSTVNISNSDSGPRSPSHDFSVADAICANCHEGSFHADQMLVSMEPDDSATASARAVNDAAAPEEQESSSWLASEGLAAITLGLGIGIGGLMGVVTMLAIGYVIQGRAQR